MECVSCVCACVLHDHDAILCNTARTYFSLSLSPSTEFYTAQSFIEQVFSQSASVQR